MLTSRHQVAMLPPYGFLLFFCVFILGLMHPGMVNAAVDLDALTPVDTTLVETQISYRSFNRRSGAMTYTATLSNVSGDMVQGPLYLAIESITAAGVTATNADDASTTGTPLLQFEALAPGESRSRSIVFSNPGRARFQFATTVYGPADQDDTPPLVDISTPGDGSATDSSPIVVTGTASDETALSGVTVNGVAATVSGDTFSASVPLSEGANTITAVATDSSGNTASTSIGVTFTPPDMTPPQVSIDSPTDGATVDTATVVVTGTASDETALSGVMVNGVAATQSGDSYSAVVPLVEGDNTLTAIATDSSGNTASASTSVTRTQATEDLTLPMISILSPADGALVIESRPAIQVQATDNIDLDTTSLALSANAQPLAADCVFSADIATCTLATANLPEGDVTLGAMIDDVAGNTGSTQVDVVVDSVPIEIEITTPADGLITKAEQVQVTGTVSEGVMAVDVNGVAASMGGGGFSATVPMREGRNMLVAVATRGSGRTGTDSVDVTRDITAPIVSIDSPGDGFVSVNDKIAVVGKVNDIVSGGTNARVLVNGFEATVAGGSYMVMDIPLVQGANVITAVATDAVGNEGSRSISVTYTPPVGARMTEGSGNGQVAQVNAVLANPLVAIVQDDLGNPVAGRVVKFEVTRNNGVVAAIAGDPQVRILQVPTDGSGRASVLFSLGDTAGEGNNRVKASAVGVAGEVEFCASGLGAGPEKVLMVDGDNQRGVVGFPLANPLEALVVDKDGNPLNGVEVTFNVVTGTGNLDGATSQMRITGTDGIARAVLTLGLDPGINNNVVNATIPGLAGLPATFSSSGLTPGNPADTKFSGVVLDNGQTPIPGAVVSIDGSTASGVTDADGQFLLDKVPVGHILLHIDPAGSPRPETFPPLEFETVTVAGQVNVLGQPILIPAIDTDSSMIVGGDEDVTIKMAGVTGLELTVFANSVTCLDGSSECRVSISQVHLDKVPMPPPSGTIFMPPAWTIQPAGTKFDPPARISIPNDGLPPGRVIDIFQFDHALNEFINVGKGTVSDDAFVIVSDPGFGITRAGWGGCGQPQPPTTCTCNCDDGNLCTTDTCSGQPNCSCKSEKLDGEDMCKICKDGEIVDKFDLDPPVTGSLTVGLPSATVTKINKGLGELTKIGVDASVSAKTLTLTFTEETCCEPTTIGKSTKTTGSVKGTVGSVTFQVKIWPPGPIPTFESPEVFIGIATIKFEAKFLGGLFAGAEASLAGELGRFKDGCSLNPLNRAGCFQAQVGASINPLLNIQLTGEACLLSTCLFCDEADKFCGTGSAKAEAKVNLNIANITFNKPNCGDGLSGGVVNFAGATFDVTASFEISGSIGGAPFKEGVSFNFLTCNTNNPISSLCSTNIF